MRSFIRRFMLLPPKVSLCFANITGNCCSMFILDKNFNQQPNSQRYWLSEMCTGEKKIPIFKINKKETDWPLFYFKLNSKYQIYNLRFPEILFQSFP